MVWGSGGMAAKEAESGSLLLVDGVDFRSRSPLHSLQIAFSARKILPAIHSTTFEKQSRWSLGGP